MNRKMSILYDLLIVVIYLYFALCVLVALLEKYMYEYGRSLPFIHFHYSV